MPVKNDVEIYTQPHKYFPNICYWIDFQCNLAMYRELAKQYGLSDQLHVDQGKEWFLMLFIQEQL